LFYVFTLLLGYNNITAEYIGHNADDL